jgi:hypothetical protein
VIKSRETSPFLTGWQGQSFFVMWWSIYICAIPVFSYNVICIHYLSCACYMTCRALSLISSTQELSFVPVIYFHVMYERKVEANHSQPSGNLGCNGICVLNIKIMKKVTKLYLYSMPWFVFCLFKVVSILQYGNVSSVWVIVNLSTLLSFLIVAWILWRIIFKWILKN